MPTNTDKSQSDKNNNKSDTRDIFLYILISLFIILILAFGGLYLRYKVFNKYTNLRNEGESNNNRNSYSYDNPLYGKTKASIVTENDDIGDPYYENQKNLVCLDDVKYCDEESDV